MSANDLDPATALAVFGAFVFECEQQRQKESTMVTKGIFGGCGSGDGGNLVFTIAVVVVVVVVVFVESGPTMTRPESFAGY